MDQDLNDLFPALIRISAVDSRDNGHPKVLDRSDHLTELLDERRIVADHQNR
jgi:hypothetical protein